MAKQQEWPQHLRDAFNEMKRTELLLDDMDYMTNSPRLQDAMQAAEKFRAALDKAESPCQK